MKLLMAHHADTSVGEYRIWTPAKYLAKLAGWTVRRFEPWEVLPRLLAMTQTQPPLFNLPGAMSEADLSIIQWFQGPHELGAIKALAAATKSPWVLELDDDVFSVPEDHYAYPLFKDRTEAECFETIDIPIEAVPAFSKRGWAIAVSPERVLARRQIALNFRPLFEEVLRHADGLQVSTPFLAGKYGPMVPEVATVVLPNCFDPDHWRTVHPAPERSYPAILWCGSNAHTGAIRSILPALRTVFATRDDARLLVLGCDLPIFKELGDRVERIGWARLRDFPRTLAATGAWVAIAPGVSNDFYAAKSHIRPMEYALAGLPTVASPIPEYDRWFRGSPGCRFATTPEEWSATLLTLLGDATLRETMRTEGRAFAWETCNIERHLGLWVTAYEEAVLRGRRPVGVPGDLSGPDRPGVSVPARTVGEPAEVPVGGGR